MGELTNDLACDWCGFSLIGFPFPHDGRCQNMIDIGAEGPVQCGTILRTPRKRKLNINTKTGIIQGWA